MNSYFTKITYGSCGPIQGKTLKLTRLHALIGPNDSGKSMALKGLLHASHIRMTADGFRVNEIAKGNLRLVDVGLGYTWFDGEEAVSPSILPSEWGGRFLRLDPDEMRKPYPLLQDSSPLRFDERGGGLGAVLDAVLARSRKAFDAVSARFIELFPTVEEFSFSTTGAGRSIGVKLKSGQRVAPEFMSEGMLYYLAFALLPVIEPTPLLLIEEPENGLHPSRIAEVVAVLREVSKTTQVVMATHSPLVVNELQPEEVTVVTRTETEGTKFTPIAQTANFANRAKTYALGELWLSYADGKEEAPLFKTGSGA